MFRSALLALASLATTLAASASHPFFCTDSGGTVVWEFTDHAHFKTINQIQVLDVPGDPRLDEILR